MNRRNSKVACPRTPGGVWPKMAALANGRRERFAQRIVEGLTAREAYHALDTGESDQTQRHRARQLAVEADVVARVRELRAPVVARVQRKFAYTLDQAMEETDAIQQKANASRDYSSALRAVELKAKLQKLLVNVTESRTSELDEMSTALLVELASELKARKAARVVAVINPEILIEGVTPAEYQGNRDPEGVEVLL